MNRTVILIELDMDLDTLSDSLGQLEEGEVTQLEKVCRKLRTIIDHLNIDITDTIVIAGEAQDYAPYTGAIHIDL